MINGWFICSAVKQIMRLVYTFFTLFVMGFFTWISASTVSIPGGQAFPDAQVKTAQGHFQQATHMACCFESDGQSFRLVQKNISLVPLGFSVILNGRYHQQRHTGKPRQGHVQKSNHPLYLLYMQLKIDWIYRNIIV